MEVMLHHKLGYQALLAIVLGIVAGLFFGPYCAVLKPIGDTFIILLQLVVIPYIPSLLMHGLGSLTPELAKKLLRNGLPILILLWLLVLAVCYAVKIVIPQPLPNPASDFSISTEIVPSYASKIPSLDISFLGVFYNIMPGIAVFSLLFGVAIMHLKEKEPLLGFLERVNNSIERVIKWISIASPIGIFAHIAHVMGTIHFEDLAKLQLYLILVIGMTLLLSVWILPTLVSCCTSIPLKEVYREFRIVSFLPFATGIPTLALPYINNAMRRLSEKKHLVMGTFRNTAQTTLPIGFGFAQIGNFVPLLFIFFLAFFYRQPFTLLQGISLPFLVTLFSVGTPQFTFIALPYLLNFLHLPEEGFSLYAEISATTLNFQVFLSTASMLTFMYLVLLKHYSLLAIQWKRLAWHGALAIALLLIFPSFIKQFLHTPDNYHNLYYGLRMDKVIQEFPEVTLFQDRTPPATPIDPAESIMSRILHRRVLRVAYDKEEIPFSYFNENEDVVGYDIAYAYQLAKDLDVKLELVPIDYTTLISDLNTGFYDVAMCAILMDEERILNLKFSNAYIEQSTVLIIPIAKAHLFTDLGKVKNNPHIKIGAIGAYHQVAAAHFTKEQLRTPQGASDLFSGAVDAFVWAELPAYIWCLAHPDYKVVSFQNAFGKQFFAYPCSQQADKFLYFLNDWLQLKQQSGFQLKQRQYWFLGESTPAPQERWSILRNVLHWVD